MKFVRIVVEAAKTYYDEAFNLMMMGAVTVLSCLLIIPGPFAFGGLWAVAQRAVRGYGIKWHIYWDGVKKYGLRNFFLVLILIFGYVIGLSNLWFYLTPEVSPLPENLTVWILPVWIVFTLIWTGILFYANAFLAELKEPKILAILRNSLFLTVLHPLTTLLLIVLAILLLAISVIIPVLILITPAMILTLRLTATRMLVQATIEKHDAMQEQTAEDTELEGT